MLNYTTFRNNNQAINESNPILSSPSCPIPNLEDPDWLLKAQLLHSTFIGRTDAYGEYVGFSNHQSIKKPLTYSVVLDHILGKRHIGVYLLTLSNNGFSSRFATFDLDTLNGFEQSLELKQRCMDLGLSTYLERSKSDLAHHLHLFFSEPIPAESLRHIANYVFSQTKWKCEFNPKQNSLPKDRPYGNYIYLPLSGRYVQDKRCVFIDDLGIAIDDQWDYLANVQKHSLSEIQAIESTLPLEKKTNPIFRGIQFVSEKLPEIPKKFKMLLKICNVVKWLWAGKRKKQTKKGGPERHEADWILGKRCIENRITDPQELIAILGTFPYGKYQRDKRMDYLKLTVEKLLEGVAIAQPLAEAELTLEQKVRDIANNLKPSILSIIHATPGVGKTYIAEKIVAEKVASDSTFRVLFGMPTIQRAEEESKAFTERFGVLASVTYGRNEKNCKNYEFVQKVESIGGSAGLSACRNCPFRSGCDKHGYYAQFKKVAQVNFCSYEQVIELHEAGKLPANLLILDEVPERAFIRHHHFSRNFVKIKPDFATPIPVIRFIDAIESMLDLAEKDKVYETESLISLFKRGLAASNAISQFGIAGQELLTMEQLLNVADSIRQLHRNVTEGNLDSIPNLRLAGVAEEIHRLWATGPELNSGLQIINRLLFHKVHRQLHSVTPILALDAYARKEYYETLIPNRDTQIHTVEAILNCTIIQVLMNPAKYRLRYLFTNQRDRIRNLIKNLVYQYCNGEFEKTIVYTYKEFVEFLQDFVDVRHLWAGRGTNIDEIKKYIIVIAGGAPNIEGLIADCKALWSQDPELIDETPNPKNKRKFIDERVELMRQVRQDDELTQVVHRIRPARAKPEDEKKIIIVNTQLIDGLVPDLIIEPLALLKTPTQICRKDALKNLINICIEDLGFWHDRIIDELREIAQTRMNIDSCRGPNKTYLIRDLTLFNHSKALGLLSDLAYPDKYRTDKNGYLKDRTEIVTSMNLMKSRVSILGEYFHHYVVYGDADIARVKLQALFVASGSNQDEESVEAMLSDKRVSELIEYSEVLEGFDGLKVVEALAKQPIPDYWKQARRDVLYIQFRSELRLQFLNRLKAMGKYIKDFFDATIQELAEIYLDLITTPNST